MTRTCETAEMLQKVEVLQNAEMLSEILLHT